LEAVVAGGKQWRRVPPHGKRFCIQPWLFGHFWQRTAPFIFSPLFSSPFVITLVVAVLFSSLFLFRCHQGQCAHSRYDWTDARLWHVAVLMLEAISTPPTVSPRSLSSAWVVGGHVDAPAVYCHALSARWTLLSVVVVFYRRTAALYVGGHIGAPSRLPKLYIFCVGCWRPYRRLLLFTAALFWRDRRCCLLLLYFSLSQFDGGFNGAPGRIIPLTIFGWQLLVIFTFFLFSFTFSFA